MTLYNIVLESHFFICFKQNFRGGKEKGGHKLGNKGKK